MDRLGVNPAVAARIRGEIEAGGAHPHLDCFISETLRYFPPIPFVVREVTRDIAVPGHRLQRGQLVLVSVVGVHHDPTCWKDPQVFDASRPEFLDGRYDRSAFVPFLTGARMCGGARLARIELTQGLKALVERFDVTRPNPDVHFDYALALRPSDLGALVVRRRADEARP
jgi:cytochrome P450